MSTKSTAGEMERLWEATCEETEGGDANFFIGAGSGRLVNEYKNPQAYADQMLDKSEGETEVEVVGDLDSFAIEKVQITNDETYKILYLSGKKKAYSIFNYLSVKSKVMGGVRKEEDLLLGEEDLQVIAELRLLTKDYFAVYSLAVLYAYLEMGIGEVQFRQKDSCLLCRALDGSVADISNVISLICSGVGITHRYCDCEFVPVIRRERSYINLGGSLNSDVTLEEGKTVVGMPVELEKALRTPLGDISNAVIKFLDIRVYMSEAGIIDSPAAVVIEDDGGILFVHNSYVGNLGPVDFVTAFLQQEEYPESLSTLELEGLEVFYYKGRQVSEFNDRYWDCETGDVID